MKNENVTTRLVNHNVMYGFAKEGRKYVIYRSTKLPVNGKYKWFTESTSHSRERCLEIYESLIKDFGFVRFYSASEKKAKREARVERYNSLKNTYDKPAVYDNVITACGY